MELHLPVNGLAGMLCEVSVSTSASGVQIKREVQKATGIPVKEQRLFIGNAEISNKMLLNEATGDLVAGICLVRRPPEHSRWILDAMSDQQGLRHAPVEAREVPEVVAAAIKQWGGDILQYASLELKSDHELVLAAVRSEGLSLQHASEQLRADREVVLAAVAQFGCALRFADDALKADRQVVLTAVSADELSFNSRVNFRLAKEGDGTEHALQYASAAMWVDHEVVLASMKTRFWLLGDPAARELSESRVFIIKAIDVHGSGLLKWVSWMLRADRVVVLAAIAMHGAEVRAKTEHQLQEDKHQGKSRELVPRCSCHRVHSPLKHASVALKVDRKVALAAVAAGGCGAWRYVARELKADQEFFCAAKALSPCLDFVQENLRWSNRLRGQPQHFGDEDSHEAHRV